jgi:putative iron-dependent peroxidase
MNTPQLGVLAPAPNHSRYIEFGALPDADAKSVLRDLARQSIDESTVIGIGPALISGIGKTVDGLRPFPNLSGPQCAAPSTQSDLWCWARADDPGHALHIARKFEQLVEPAFRADRVVDGFKFDRGLDLSGYEDGTENPVGDDAFAAAITKNASPALDGSTFVAVQQWVHDLFHFESLSQKDRDNIIGRRLSDNEELDDAPISAHVKRTAQESFDPEAFIIRRSLPWGDATGEGLMFVAFGESLDAFEAQLRRMTGQEDDVIDGLFRFSRPVSGSYFWCPPVSDGKLVLSALGI